MYISCQVTVFFKSLHRNISKFFFHFFRFVTPTCVRCSSMSASFQSLLAPYEALIEFRAKLTQCRQSLQFLADSVPEILPDAKEWINMSVGLLDRIEPQLRRTEYQMLCILQLQLHHTLEQLGHLAHVGSWLTFHWCSSSFSLPVRTGARLNQDANSHVSK